MALKDTTKHLKELLNHITTDIEKAEGGNKAASQRVRTGTVKLEKIAKQYRKESIHSEKQPRSSKKSTSSHGTKKPAHKPAAKAKSHGHSPSHAKSSASSAKVKAKPKAAIAKARPRALSVKRPTAKLPSRSLSFR
ncbi:MAG: histone [Parachlamydiales bacterium]|jgi:hypothetical protein